MFKENQECFIKDWKELLVLDEMDQGIRTRLNTASAANIWAPMSSATHQRSQTAAKSRHIYKNDRGFKPSSSYMRSRTPNKFTEPRYIPKMSSNRKQFTNFIGKFMDFNKDTNNKLLLENIMVIINNIIIID